MKKSSLFSTSIILMFFFAGLISQTAAQGIRNEGATINIASVVMLSARAALSTAAVLLPMTAL